MIDRPFPLFEQFGDRLRVTLFTKEDGISTDEQIAEKSNVPIGHLASLHQVHGNRTIRIIHPTRRSEKADGMATDQTHLLLSLRTADCQSFVIYEPKKNVVGLVHVGWRGVEAGVIPSLYQLLKQEWDIDPADTFVGAGPSLGFECAEFTDPTKELPSVPYKFMSDRLVDLNVAADHQLELLGVPSSQRARISDCTKCHPEKYWTYRGGDREKVLKGYENVLTCVLL